MPVVPNAPVTVTIRCEIGIVWIKGKGRNRSSVVAIEVSIPTLTPRARVAIPTGKINKNITALIPSVWARMGMATKQPTTMIKAAKKKLRCLTNQSSATNPSNPKPVPVLVIGLIN
jgi:hypothetical protein